MKPTDKLSSTSSTPSVTFTTNQQELWSHAFSIPKWQCFTKQTSANKNKAPYYTNFYTCSTEAKVLSIVQEKHYFALNHNILLVNLNRFSECFGRFIIAGAFLIYESCNSC